MRVRVRVRVRVVGAGLRIEYEGLDAGRHRLGQHRNDVRVLARGLLGVAREDLGVRVRVGVRGRGRDRVRARVRARVRVRVRARLRARARARVRVTLTVPSSSMWICVRSPSYLNSHVKRPAWPRLGVGVAAGAAGRVRSGLGGGLG